MAKAPWSWGRMHNILSFLHSFGGAQDRIPSPITKKREKPAREKKSKLETKRKKKARPRTTIDARARSKKLEDSILSS